MHHIQKKKRKEICKFQENKNRQYANSFLRINSEKKASSTSKIMFMFGGDSLRLLILNVDRKFYRLLSGSVMLWRVFHCKHHCWNWNLSWHKHIFFQTICISLCSPYFLPFSFVPVSLRNCLLPTHSVTRGTWNLFKEYNADSQLLNCAPCSQRFKLHWTCREHIAHLLNLLKLHSTNNIIIDSLERGYIDWPKQRHREYVQSTSGIHR